MLYVWEILKQFFQAVLLPYSAAFVAEQCGFGSAYTLLNYLVQLITNGTLILSTRN
jgi:hypothetical protein